MPTTTFPEDADERDFKEHLLKGGFSESQADHQIDVNKAMLEHLVTKDDLKASERKMRLHGWKVAGYLTGAMATLLALYSYLLGLA